MTDKLEEQINNTPALSEIRARRAELVTVLFQDKFPEKLTESPCVSCENCNWRKTTGGLITAYCKVNFDYVYDSLTGDFDREKDVILHCIDFEMAEE